MDIDETPEPEGGRREAGGEVGEAAKPEIGNRESGNEVAEPVEAGVGNRESGIEEKAETEAPAAEAAPAASEPRGEVPDVAAAPPASRPPEPAEPTLEPELVSEPEPLAEEPMLELPASVLRRRSRRDFLLFGLGTAAAVAGFWWVLPDDTRRAHLTPRLRDWLDSLDARLGATPGRRETLLNSALTFDDDVAEALYSPTRSVRTYSRSQVTPLKNNYNGATPGPGYIPGWMLAVSGLASGETRRFTIADLTSRFARHDQVTRLCCVEGWSAVAWWGGLQFADFLRAFPPAPGARWARLDSAVNLDGSGNPDPYYVSIDLPTARHAQTLLATHLSGRPLDVAHGAPLRLVAPMKLGLKNIKAITSITYSREEPADYWAERGYSRYDGL